MKVSEAFPSRYLKATDLQSKRVAVVIDRIVTEEIGDIDGHVMYFKGKDKGVVLNKTNATMIEEIAKTDDMDRWGGTRIVLYPTRVDFQGKRVLAIRVDYPDNGKSPPVPSSSTTDPDDHDIDF